MHGSFSDHCSVLCYAWKIPNEFIWQWLNFLVAALVMTGH